MNVVYQDGGHKRTVSKIPKKLKLINYVLWQNIMNGNLPTLTFQQSPYYYIIVMRYRVS